MLARPHISANFAISADGKITSAVHCPSGWTSTADQQRLMELRVGADALLVGRGTLETDRTPLVIPAKFQPPRQPLRCIVSRRGLLDLEQPLFHTVGGAIHLLITSAPAHFDPAPLASRGVTIHHGTVASFLTILAEQLNVRRLHCEGGGDLMRELLELDVVDTLYLTWAGHTLFGGRNAPTISGPPGEFLPASLAFELDHFEPRPDIGECFLTYRRKRDGTV